MFDVSLGPDNSAAILREMERNLERAETESASRCAETARRTVRRRSGRTAASIEAHPDGSVTAGEASVFLERGTVRMPAFPFLGPAFDREVEPTVERMREI